LTFLYHFFFLLFSSFKDNGRPVLSSSFFFLLFSAFFLLSLLPSFFPSLISSHSHREPEREMEDGDRESWRSGLWYDFRVYFFFSFFPFFPRSSFLNLLFFFCSFLHTEGDGRGRPISGDRFSGIGIFFSGFISGDLLLFGCIEFDFGFRAFWFDNFRRIGLMN
jgi:hypothetical protein